MNVEELIQKKKLVYRQQGADFVVHCLNPEHDDSNPSMRIDRITGIFHCFSCGFKGNVFKYFDAPVSFLEQKRAKLKKKINDRRTESVGLTMPKDLMAYSGNFRNIKPETYEKYEAFTHHESQYVGRVVFPIKDITGRVSAFIGRHMDSTAVPKYMIFPPKAKMPLFPSHANPILGRVILVEGIFDALNLLDKGLSNAMCCFGTRNMDIYKLSMLKVQGVTGLDILFDGDTAGREAADSIVELCDKVELLSQVVQMPEGLDPGALPEDRVKNLKEWLYDEPEEHSIN